MTIVWKDENMKLHGKRHKRDPFFFRWHYGKQRLVYITKEYVDKPTENQKASRNTFTTIRQEVSRQLKDKQLKARWQAKFQADPQGYKFLHTYVYAQLKAGVTIRIETPFMRVSPQRPSHPSSPRRLILSHSTDNSPQETHHRCVSTCTTPMLVLYNGTLVPLFLPAHVPKDLPLRIFLRTFAAENKFGGLIPHDSN